ncbi:hypothetical protein MLD38_002986 [Melastoma candidum]|uniref:Uncharacterized protein n=1 Tax=Melastoma candidum TaxID=119954 RepID=A0ACB9S0D5_9MYRT|nr:hypothetical protein MLD38_002986 [Melastoma candidum]
MMEQKTVAVWWSIFLGVCKSEDVVVDMDGREGVLSYVEGGGHGYGYGVSPSAAPAPLMVGLTLIEGAADKGAVCSDGTSPGYHLHRGSGSGAISWLIQLETTPRGSSKYMEKQLPFPGWCNTVRNCVFRKTSIASTRIVLRYCDRASFKGSSQNELIFSSEVNKYASCHGRVDVPGNEECQAGSPFWMLCRWFVFDTTLRRVLRVITCYYKSQMPKQCWDVSCCGGCIKRAHPKESLPKCPGLAANFCSLFCVNVRENLPDSCTTTSHSDPTLVPSSLVPPTADPHGIWNDCKTNHELCNFTHIAFFQDLFSDNFRIEEPNAGSCKSFLCFRLRDRTHGSLPIPLIGNTGIAESVGDWYFDRKSVKPIDCAYSCDRTCHSLV